MNRFKKDDIVRSKSHGVCRVSEVFILGTCEIKESHWIGNTRMRLNWIVFESDLELATKEEKIRYTLDQMSEKWK